MREAAHGPGHELAGVDRVDVVRLHGLEDLDEEVEPGIEAVRGAAAARPPAEREQRAEEGAEEDTTTHGNRTASGDGKGRFAFDYSRRPGDGPGPGRLPERGQGRADGGPHPALEVIGRQSRIEHLEALRLGGGELQVAGPDAGVERGGFEVEAVGFARDRKSTRLNS